MRTTYFAAAAFALFAFCGAAEALETSDTMASWRAATNNEKAKLVIELLKRDGRESAVPSVVKCLDAAAGIPGHAELSIGQIIKACAKEGSEPV